MSPEFLTKLQTIIETGILAFLGVALPIVSGFAVAYLRRLAQEKHTDQAVAAAEQKANVEAATTGVAPTGAQKYQAVVQTLLDAGVRPDPTLIEAAVLAIKQGAPCPPEVK